jgi:hypothetical protein
MYISSNEEYPRYLGDIILEFPNFIEGQTLPEGWREVALSPMPETTATERAQEVFPELINNVWVQKWIVRDATAEELQYEKDRMLK